MKSARFPGVPVRKSKAPPKPDPEFDAMLARNDAITAELRRRREERERARGSHDQ